MQHHHRVSFLPAKHSSVIIMVPSWCSIESAAGTDRADFGHRCFLRPIIHCVLRQFWYLRNRDTSHWNTVSNTLDLKELRIPLRHIERCMLCSQLRPTTAASFYPVWAREHCRISPPRFLAECCKRQLNQGSFVLLRLVYFFWFVLSLFICIFLYCFVCQYQLEHSNSQFESIRIDSFSKKIGLSIH